MRDRSTCAAMTAGQPLTAVQTGRGTGGGGRQREKVRASLAARARQGAEQVKARSRVTDRPTQSTSQIVSRPCRLMSGVRNPMRVQSVQTSDSKIVFWGRSGDKKEGHCSPGLDRSRRSVYSQQATNRTFWTCATWAV